MTVRDIYDLIDRYAPFSIAMEHDNAGLLIGRQNSEVSGVLVTLDADYAAMEHAIEAGCNVIVSHHPFIFEGENHISDRSAQGEKILFALEQGLNIISAHTNLDSCEGGINDTLGELLGLTQTDKFIPTQNGGMLGRIGSHNFDGSAEFITHAAEVLGTKPRYRICNDRFERIAWVSGSGASCMDDALWAGADTLVTGDCKYSAFMDAAEKGINLIDLGHFETEQIIVPVIADLLRENGIETVEHITDTPIRTLEDQ